MFVKSILGTAYIYQQDLFETGIMAVVGKSTKSFKRIENWRGLSHPTLRENGQNWVWLNCRSMYSGGLEYRTLEYHSH